MKRIIAGFLAAMAIVGPWVFVNAENAPLNKERNISVEISGEWAIARQGRDETSQECRVRIWGTVREPSFFETGFHQLDDDPEDEYVVISRQSGTGPYYRLQIIDFHENGILTWSYYSEGKPKVEEGKVLLGHMPQGDKGASTVAVYEQYSYSVSGLEREVKSDE